MSLVSNHEPSEVVYHLKKENLPFRSSESSHPTSMFHHAAIGRWRIGACPVLASLPVTTASAASSTPSARTQHELEHGCTRDSTPFALEGNCADQDRRQMEEDLFIESEGLNSTYMFAMHLSIQSSSSGAKSSRGGGGVRNNKLMWKSYWSHNRVMDLWHQFPTTDDSPFFWSRVKSYGAG